MGHLRRSDRSELVWLHGRAASPLMRKLDGLAGATILIGMVLLPPWFPTRNEQQVDACSHLPFLTGFAAHRGSEVILN
jgi:hypothetical protein